MGVLTINGTADEHEAALASPQQADKPADLPANGDGPTRESVMALFDAWRTRKEALQAAKHGTHLPHG